MLLNCKTKLNLKKMFVVFGVVTFGLYGVESYASSTNTGHDHSKMDHSKMDHSTMGKKSRETLSNETKKSVIAVLEANEELHSTFFKYDGDKVQKSAMNLKKVMETIDDKDIAKLLSFSKKKLSEIKSSNDREVNNNNYNLVSMALIYVVNKYDVGAKYNSYSCPMVKKKWIQNSKKMAKIHNPYAPNMPHCGEQVSTY